uniref:Ovule protein n=1 Tax=Haemonchus placei TaxID=6290 RepID=A0A0N4X7A1_HAEPC
LKHTFFVVDNHVIQLILRFITFQGAITFRIHRVLIPPVIKSTIHEER